MRIETDRDALRAIMALPLLPGVGLRRAKELILHYGSAEEVLRKEHTLEGIKTALERAEKELQFIEKHHLQTYYFEDDDYPHRLAQCPDCPILLFGKGNLRLNEGKFVSVVGTRSPSERGKQLCHDLVAGLAAKVPDVTIVSGLAYGIDVTAHKAALESGLPTIIIPGHGLDRIYPSIHRQVAVQALEKGGILTEYMSETEPLGPNFVARNRIIAGMSEAVVVVESRMKGGSLITADIAFAYNRDLFAFPGRPADTNSSGCNWLIKTNQAQLIENADDLIAAMRWSPKKSGDDGYQTTLDQLLIDLVPEEQMLLDILHQNEDGIHVNSLVAETRMPYAATSSLLFQMEMRGLVRSLPGGLYVALK
jgi:DNA processing protein